MGLFNLFKSSKTVVVIDGVSLNEALGMKGKVPPRTQLQLLRRLSRFAQREKIGMVVVLSGSPLHKAPAGKKFEEITVVYSKSLEAHAKYTVKTARSKGSGAILVSGNASVEKIVGSGMKAMRVSTFRKAFDIGGNDIESSERPDRNSGERSGRNRSPRRRSQKQSNSSGNEAKKERSKQERSKKERPKQEMSDADAINELIDLVD
ncbi:MAG: hypothetical protein ABFR47_05505 [Verrucomicrobiota bacterium]